jgi:hypothetical protein
MLVFGALGVAGLAMSNLGAQLRSDTYNVILLLAAFAIPVVVATLGLVKPPIRPWQGGLALSVAVMAVIKLRLWNTLPRIADAPLGGKLVLVATLGGLVLAILAIAKPES